MSSGGALAAARLAAAARVDWYAPCAAAADGARALAAISHSGGDHAEAAAAARPYPGTTSLDGAHLIAVVADMLRELIRHGQRRLVLCDGHYENQWFLVEAAELVAREARASGVRIVRAEHWDYCAPEVLAAVFPAGLPGFALEHAAVIETSLMLHYAPELVRLDRLPDDGPAHFRIADVYPQDGHGVPLSGVLSSARGASAAHGARLARSIGERFAAEVREIFALG